MEKPGIGHTLLAVALFCGPAATLAAEVEHYEGKPAETLEQAVTNFSEYNRKLERILSKDELTAEDMEAVHRLTYTLENALQKIHSEVGGMAGTLEAVHQSSERHDRDTLNRKGANYLDSARTLIP